MADNRTTQWRDIPTPRSGGGMVMTTMDADKLDAKALLEGTTPGPWALEVGQNGSLAVGPPRADGSLADVLLFDGDVPDYYEKAKHRITANYRLIAAAPQLAREHIAQAELIARMREALEWAMKDIRQPRLIRGQNDAYCAEYAKASAALALPDPDQQNQARKPAFVATPSRSQAIVTEGFNQGERKEK